MNVTISVADPDLRDRDSDPVNNDYHDLQRKFSFKKNYRTELVTKLKLTTFDSFVKGCKVCF